MKPPLRRGAAFLLLAECGRLFQYRISAVRGKTVYPLSVRHFVFFPLLQCFFADFISKSERFISKKEMKRNFLCELLCRKVKELYICISHL